MRKGLVMSAGATFIEVYDKVQKEYKFKTKAEGNEYTRQLLKIPASEIDDLKDTDQEIIEGYETSP